MSDEVLEQEDEGMDMGVIILMLGLYLIVLAFFILLNAISEDSPERRELVVESVQEGFDFRQPGELLGPDDTEITAIPLYDATESAIEGVLQAYLSFEEYEVQRQADRLFVSMPVERFFQPGAVRLIPEMILFFEDLASVLGEPKPGLKIMTEVLVRGDEDGVPAGDVPLVIAGQRATLFTRALNEQGVPAETLSAAAMVEDPRVIMMFDVEITNPKAALEAAAALQGLEATMGTEATDNAP